MGDQEDFVGSGFHEFKGICGFRFDVDFVFGVFDSHDRFIFAFKFFYEVGDQGSFAAP